MAGYVGRLESNETLSAEGHFAGPWRSFERRSVPRGDSVTFDAADAEYSVFVMSGTGEVRIGEQRRPLDAGAALTIGYRSAVTISAAEDLELFVTTLDVHR